MVYLSGSMDGVSIEEGNGWRRHASKYLREHGFEVYNPYERKEGNFDHSQYSTNEIAHNDIYYLEKSEILLANLVLPKTIENSKIPFFTIGEMFLARESKKPVIACTNCLKGRPGYEFVTTKTLDTIDECLEYIVLNYT